MVTSIPVNKASLIDWLKEKGTSLGFHAETKYICFEDNAIAEVAWLLNPGQKPILIFIIEETDLAIFSGVVMQWIGSSTEPKSWFQICIFLGEPTNVPSSLLLPSNVKLYDAHNLSRLPDDIEVLIENMSQLYKNYVNIFPSIPLKEAVKRIRTMTVNWPVGKQNTRLSLNASAKLNGGFYLFAAETEDDEATEKPVLKPSRKVVPLDISSGDASFEGALMRLVDADGGQFLLSTEHRNYPFIFRLYVKGGEESTLDLWFDVDKSNILQVLEFWALVEAVTSSCSLILSSASDVVASLTVTR